MSNIDELIEQLRKSADFEDYPVVASFAAIIEKKYLRDAATALSTLRAENTKLRAELEYEKEHAGAYYEECGQWEAENEQLRSDLRRLQTERDTLWAANQHLLAERDADRKDKEDEHEAG